MWSLDKLLKQYMGINLVYKYAIVHTDCVSGLTVRQVMGENEKRDKEKERANRQLRLSCLSLQWRFPLIHKLTSYNEIIQWDQIPLARHNEEQRIERINFHSRICAHYLEMEVYISPPSSLESQTRCSDRRVSTNSASTLQTKPSTVDYNRSVWFCRLRSLALRFYLHCNNKN